MNNDKKNSGIGCLGILGLMLLTVVLSIGGSFWLIKTQLFQKEFKPIELSSSEESVLSDKLSSVGLDLDFANTDDKPDENKPDNMQPEPYQEDASKRNIALTERELNALIANNSNLAQRMVIDLADDLASIKMLIHLDPEFPFVGGKTLKVSAGAELAYKNQRPVVILKGVSVWGIPIPNDWLGGLKNVDLVNEFGGEEGFWKAFAGGIEDIHVKKGQLLIKLKE